MSVLKPIVRPVRARSFMLLGAVALLSACGGKTGGDDLNKLDANLTNGADNQVVGQAAGQVAGVDQSTSAAAVAAMKAARAAVGGSILRAPAAKAMDGEPRPTATSVNGKARSATGKCANAVQYGDEWADKIRKPFRVYPQAQLTEAAGVDSAKCHLRILNFTTPVAVDQVIDYYYTQASHAGFDAEQLLIKGELQLGGTRASDGAAYIVFARHKTGGGSDVDIVAN